MNRKGDIFVNIYIIVDPRDKTFNPRYVGITTYPIKTRMSHHMKPYELKDNTYKNNWIKSLVKENIFPQIKLVDIVYGWENACEIEKSLIKIFRKNGFKLTNLTDGGDGTLGLKGPLCAPSRMVGELNPMFGKFGINHPAFGNKMSEEHRQTMLKIHKGKIVSSDTRKKMSDSWKLRSPMSDETKELISDLSIERWNNDEFKSKMSLIHKRISSEFFTNRNREIVECPYCGHRGMMGGMQRWHFDRCKLKNINI